mmetsp:Transcript_7681/g.12595  ORF Transcript_7681/g.12595 Transcript_7681/m.12595 type:complete len:125 (+) Transcript_7681:33-407(+)
MENESERSTQECKGMDQEICDGYQVTICCEHSHSMQEARSNVSEKELISYDDIVRLSVVFLFVCHCVDYILCNVREYLHANAKQGNTLQQRLEAEMDAICSHVVAFFFFIFIYHSMLPFFAFRA